jgi:hypothetical protein
MRLTYANVMSTVAVFVALGGSSYAAITLGKNAVKSKNIAPDAVTSSKVKNGSLRAKDFKAGDLPAGARGADGAQGLQGPKGDKGDPAAFPTTLPAGKTETGVFAAEQKVPSGGTHIYDSISFNIRVASAPSIVLVPHGTTQTHCTGSAGSPTADPGYLCVYERVVSGGNFIVFAPSTGSETVADKTGAVASLTEGATDSWFYGTWAVTAS